MSTRIEDSEDPPRVLSLAQLLTIAAYPSIATLRHQIREAIAAGEFELAEQLSRSLEEKRAALRGVQR
jgi:hypothetical protein